MNWSRQTESDAYEPTVQITPVLRYEKISSLNFGPTTDRRTQSDAYEPTVHMHWCAQKYWTGKVFSQIYFLSLNSHCFVWNLINSLSRTHCALDVQCSDILPILLQKRYQEVDCKVDIRDQFLLGHVHVTNCNSQTQDLKY